MRDEQEGSNSTLERIFLHSNYKWVVTNLMDRSLSLIVRHLADGLERSTKNSLKVSKDLFIPERFWISHYIFSNEFVRTRLEKGWTAYWNKNRGLNKKSCLKVFQQDWERARLGHRNLHSDQGCCHFLEKGIGQSH